MTKMNVPGAPSIRTTVYGNFRGVDFSVDPSLVDKNRSPYAPNMISDNGGNPVKRPGWRVLHQLEGRINGLFYAEMDGRPCLIAHAGTELYKIAGATAVKIKSGISDSKSTAFYMSAAGNDEIPFDSKKYTGAYPQTLTLASGRYIVAMGGGKGADMRFREGTNKDEIFSKGGAGGTIVLQITLETASTIRIEKISNGSAKLRVSYHVFVNDVIYAAVGGGGDCGGGDMLSDLGYYGAYRGGSGGGDSAGNGDAHRGSDGAGGQGAAAANGGKGGYAGATNTDENTYYPGESGGAFPLSRGGGSNESDAELSDRVRGAGGCGYAGGGQGGELVQRKNTRYIYYGAGGGGSSYVKIDQNVTVNENSAGTNDGPGYIKIMRKAADTANWSDKIYILTGNEYLSYDGQTVESVMDSAYVPTILISRLPAGGGTMFEAVNLIQPKRTESFLGDEVNKDYHLSATGIDAEKVKVKVANNSGDYDELTENAEFTVDRSAGVIKFKEVKKPIVAGQDNVLITYSKTVSGYVEKIKNCTICTLYGVGGSNRVFLTGNPEYKSYDWWSDIFKPAYFPDLNYAVIGTGDTAVMGYQKLGEYLSIIKEDNQQDTTIFLRSGALNENGDAVFSVKPGIAGIGALSRHCFANLGDEPLFLSRQGIYATTSTLLSSERVTKNRSFFVDKHLTKEPNLKAACACEWNGYYVLQVNGNLYILDGRHKSGDRNGNTDFVYECYLFTNIPATCLLSLGGDLYFGTADGRICKFNTDDLPNAKMTIYSDGGKLNSQTGRIEGGTAIDAAWFTPNDDDGAAHLFKTLQKKGSLVTISPYDRSSGEVCFVVDGSAEEIVKKENMDIFDWEDIDFERFAFNSNESPQEIYFYKKKKKYKRLQIGIRNRQLNEGFGIHQIVKSFAVGNYSKNRG